MRSIERSLIGCGRAWAELLAQLASGAVMPSVGGVLGLEEAGEAHRLIAGRTTQGKLVLKVG